MTDLNARDLIQRLADELDHYKKLLMDDRRETHALANEARAYLAKSESDGPAVLGSREPASVITYSTSKELLERIETLEAAAQKHIVETSANILALASRIEALELAKRQSSKVLDLSDLPQWTPEQVQNLQDLLGTYRNHLGLND
jgi:hypothetical protein